MLFRQIRDEKLAQYAYLIGCQQTREALLIDPERDVDRYINLAAHEGLRIVAAADTHIHADYLTGLRELAERGVHVYASDEGGPDWRYEWLLGSDYAHTLLHDGDTFTIGNIEVRAVFTPGHTPEHLSFLITDHGGGADEPMGLLSGDFVFVGDLGRPDLLETAAGQAGAREPAARDLYRSVQRFLDLPDYLQVWPAHGAGSACGKALGAVPDSTVGYERRFNGAVQAAQRSEQAFVDTILDGQPEPPLYFARMKRDNRRGPKVLGQLPRPRRLTVSELADLAGRTDVAVVDTRVDRSAFMHGHLPGALYAPFNKTFNTVVGSYVEEDVPLYLIIEDAQVDEAVRDLVRIGLDEIVGYATAETLEQYVEDEGALARIEEADFARVAELHEHEGVEVLDVRGAAEYRSGHIPGARNIAHTRLRARMDELPAETTLVVHCASGARSAVASAMLERHGFDVVYVSDRFEHWPEHGALEGVEAVEA